MKTEFILFCKPSCPYCVKAHELLQEKDLEYQVVNFEPEDQQVLDQIKEAYQWKTVPMVFVKNAQNTTLIGGYSDLALFLEQE
tara:strand:+ start:389 stop:637 length:249 start_codon:yes stop_codon:yes gene_type:complete